MNCNQLFQSDFCFNSGADESWLSVAYRHVLSCNFKEIFLKRWLKNLICKMYYYIRKCCNIKKEHKQLHLVKRCHSSRNDLYSMSLSSNLFKLSKHVMHSFRKKQLDFWDLPNRAHKAQKMKLAWILPYPRQDNIMKSIPANLWSATFSWLWVRKTQ